jgi:ATP-dependent Clp protease ATP-binding subunit ClpA
MDYATLTDNTGRKADFRNVILIMTSNAGAREMAAKAIGFGSVVETDVTSRGLKEVEKTFSPEFRNRLDALVPFHGLSEEIMLNIVDKFVAELEGQMKDKRVRIEMTDAARKRLAKLGYDPAFGARPMRRAIRRGLEDDIAREVLFGALQRGGIVKVGARKLKASEGKDVSGLTFTFTSFSGKDN